MDIGTDQREGHRETAPLVPTEAPDFDDMPEPAREREPEVVEPDKVPA